MQRVSEIVGKPIVSAATGEKAGDIADVLIDPTATHLVGLVVGGGLLGSEHVLPYRDVQAVGKDAVVARTTDGLLDASEWRDQHIAASRSSALRNRRVITSTGRELGTVKDLRMDERTGAVEGYEVATGGLPGASRRRFVPQAGGVTIGPDAVVVSEHVAEAAEQPGDKDRDAAGQG